MGHSRTHLVSLAIGFALLNGCAAMPQPKAAAGESSAGNSRSDSAPAAQALPQMSPSAEAQFHVLMGETAAGRDQPELAAEEFLKALDGAPDPQLAARATAYALEAKRSDLALAAAQRWLQIEPNSLDAREALIALALGSGNSDLAFEQCQAVLRDHPAGIGEGFHYLALLLSKGATSADASLALMDRLVDAHSDNPAAYRSRSLLELRFNKLDLAENSARQALKLEPKSDEASLLLTAILVRKGNIAESDAVVESLSKTQKNPNDTRLSYARLLLESNQGEAARRQYEAVAKSDPQNTDARLALGLLAIDAHNLDEAETRFKQLAANPKQASDAAYFLGRIAELRNRPQQALSEYAKVTSGSQALDAEVRHAVLLGKLNHVDEAIQAFSSMREQYPPLAQKLALAEGDMLIEAGRYDEAVSLYTDTLSNVQDDTDLLYSRSLAYEKLNQIDKAEADLREVLGEKPDDAHALNALGYMLTVHSDHFDEAKAMIDRAYSLMPNDPAIIDSLGWVNYRQGHLTEALPLLQKAYKLFPDPEVAAHLGEVLWALDQKTEAKAIWNAAITQDPGNTYLRETIKRLAP